MTRRSWEPFFTADIPDDWHVTEADGIVEAAGPEEALQVSVLRRTNPGLPTANEAVDVAQSWADKLSLKPKIETVAFAKRAVASFDARGGSWRRRVRWLFRTDVVETHAVRASVNQTGRAIQAGVGTQVLRSVIAFPASETMDQALHRRFGPAWRTGPPLGMAAVAAFEAEHAVELPEPYRLFITDIANGAIGPPHYGLLPIGERKHMSVGPVEPTDLARPFPLEIPWVWEDDPAARDEEIEEARRFGILPLGTDGDGMDFVLVVSGAARGQVWEITDVGAVAVAPTFRDWIRG
jgi:SMI1 / KNR4 family (SUKH-1)